MDMKIINQKENPLLNRKEVMIEVTHLGTSTPLRNQLIAGVAKSVKTSEDLVIINKIITKKGSASCEAKVLVYKKKEDIPKELLEKQTRRLAKAKSAKKEAKEEGDKPAEDSKEEVPKEEKKKEEAKSEEPAKEEKKEEPKKEEPKPEEKPAEEAKN